MKKIIFILLISNIVCQKSIAQEIGTFAGSGTASFLDATGTMADFSSPSDIAIDASGNLYVTDPGNARIRKISPSGIVTTFAGNGIQASVDGNGVSASFTAPRGITIDKKGNLYVSEPNGNKIRKITPEGEVSTFAGSGIRGNSDGNGINATFNAPYGMVFGTDGNLYVTESLNHQIRKISPNGDVSVFAGAGVSGNIDAAGKSAKFYSPVGITVDAFGNFYVADNLNNQIRKITPNGEVITLAGNGERGYVEGKGTIARFNAPYGITINPSSELIVTERGGNRVRVVTLDGITSLFAGTGAAGNKNGALLTATFNAPRGLAFDPYGALFIADVDNNIVRKVESTITNLDGSHVKTESINIYPLPAENKLNIQSTEQFTDYQIYHSKGSLVENGKLTNNTIMVENLKSGQYYLQLNSPKGKVVKKFVKQ